MAVETKPDTLVAEPWTAQEHKGGSEELGVERPVSKDSDLPLLLQEFPEGGLAAWSTAFGAFLILFCTWGYVTSFGVYQDFYAQNYLTNETSTAISILMVSCRFIGSINAFLGTSVSLVAGTLYDRGYFYHLVITGSLLQSFSLFMLSLAKPNQYYQVFLTQGLGSGIAVGLLYIPSLAIVSHYFRRKRTLVMAFVTLGSSLGAIVHPIMLNNLLNGRLGFANGVRASAGLLSALLLIACLCMRPRLDPPTTPVNYIVAAKKCLRDIPFFFAAVGAFLFQIGFYYPYFFLQLDSTQHGISISSYSLVILSASSSVGRLSAGYIAGYIGVPNLTVISAISCGLIILGTVGLSSPASVVIIGVLYGYFSGVYTAIVGPLMATLTHDPSELGGWMGIGFFIGGFGSLIGTPISGALLTSDYIWWKPALFSGVSRLRLPLLYPHTL
ncbi:major facilitator superfamily domain-containing protein [Suillus fuscotomentosus]|uniref:Major facilitator superfamily domain-containing protein n=1 Tax=Suillus fuscotomentosus TaxID=1912939 RepID=A0AAD4EBI9_9AGAM|nr:major facilitator superfamily domain-containing protein [Suillus fuscotomentosus]KAG1903097.1 major facilitator superfamily domain-containing protein [Suillus fuscotomentosus]